MSRKSLLLLYIVTRNSGAEIVIWVRCDIWYFGHDKLFISLQYVIGVFYIGTYSYKGLDHPSVAHNLILIYPKRVTP